MHTVGWVLVKNYVSRSHEHTVTHCNTLQHTATQHTTTRTAFLAITNTLQHTATHCNTTHYNKDCFFRYHERAATHCNTLPHKTLSRTWFYLLLVLETVIQNSCLRVYYLKSIWIWVLGFRPESNRGPADNIFPLSVVPSSTELKWRRSHWRSLKDPLLISLSLSASLSPSASLFCYFSLCHISHQLERWFNREGTPWHMKIDLRPM